MIMSFWVEASSISSNPLFSSVVTLYTLILLYLPSHFTAIAFSPVLILTAALLLSLLRLGASQARESPPPPSSPADENDTVACPNDDDDQTEEDHDREWSDTDSDSDSEPEAGFDPSPSFESSFVPWNLRVPLEVIYEEEEEDADDESLGFERNRSLSRYFAESDSDISSGGDLSAMGFCDSPENLRFEWDEEDRDEELIEIAFNNINNNYNEKKKMKVLDFHVDEDSFIEIDISNQVRFNL